MRKLRVFPALAAAALVCTAVPGVSAQTHVLHKVTFSGATDYTQDELLTFTGLKPGMAATQQQIEDAAQKLGDTGLFEDVSFSGNEDGLTYTLKPAAAASMMPARFGNFVWWQDDELERDLKTKVPLYHGGAVPLSGNIRQTIAAALVTMVAEKGVANPSVNSMPGSTKPGAAPDRIVFAMDAPAVVVHSVSFTGGSAAMQTKLERIRGDLAGQPWDEVESPLNINGRVTNAYHNEGYLDITVAKPERSAPGVTANGVAVDLTAMLNEGAQYHVKQLAWAGSEILSAEDFRNRAILRVGDPDSPLKLAETLKLLRDAYGSRGYIEAKVNAPQEIGRSAHEVSYTIDVAQGPQYHFRSVRWPSVSADQEKQFTSEWKMKPGDVYDNSYPIKFMQQHTGLVQHGYTMSVQETRDRGALMIDLVVRIDKPGAPAQP